MHAASRRLITKLAGKMAGTVLMAAVLASSAAAPASADPARPDPARPEPSSQLAPAVTGHRAMAVISFVRARDLMSGADHQAYRRAIRQADSAEARQRIREATLKTLHERAAEHGVVMMIDTRMMRLPERRAEPESAPHLALPPRAP
ncbi:MAG: hypothetical protein WCK65_01865 [Rhodospirillaceae bacterium]